MSLCDDVGAAGFSLAGNLSGAEGECRGSRTGEITTAAIFALPVGVGRTPESIGQLEDHYIISMRSPEKVARAGCRSGRDWRHRLRRGVLIPLSFLAGAFLVFGSNLQAATSSLGFSSAEVGYAANPSTRGYVFIVTSPVQVTGLSVYDFEANGLVEDHTVGLWNSAGKLLASAFIPKGEGSPLDHSGKFRFVLLETPVLLDTGEGYRVGATFGGLGPAGDAQFFNQSPITMAGDMFYVQGAYVNQTTGLNYPSEVLASGLGGGSFVIGSVPEAGVAVLGSLGLLLLVVRRRHTAPSPDRQAKKRATS